MAPETLNHYKVLQRLGEGGMGEVYVAEDSKLNRKVALKALPSEMSADPDRRTRLQREAQAVAALNRPNIVTIYSIEEASGLLFLTMELVEGQLLADLIPAGGFALNRVLEIAVPLADALSAAHDADITHRDLKPESDISLPSNCRARQPTTAPTFFALGVIFYQLATGRFPFGGSTQAELISSVLRDAPRPVADLRPDLPRHLGRIIRRCLEKDPKRRYQATLDLRHEVEDLQAEVTAGDVFEESRPAALAARPGQETLPVEAEYVRLTMCGCFRFRSGTARFGWTWHGAETSGRTNEGAWVTGSSTTSTSSSPRPEVARQPPFISSSPHPGTSPRILRQSGHRVRHIRSRSGCTAARGCMNKRDRALADEFPFEIQL